MRAKARKKDHTCMGLAAEEDRDKHGWQDHKRRFFFLLLLLSMVTRLEDGLSFMASSKFLMLQVRALLCLDHGSWRGYDGRIP